MRREIASAALLLLGGAVIIASLIYTGMHLNDRVVVTVLVPGVVVGLMLIGVYVAIGKRHRRS